MKQRILALCVALTLGLGSQTPAARITFTHEGSGSGTLNGVPFPVSDFVITAVGDTDDREPFMFGDGFFIVHITASISIDGVGTVDFISGTRTFVNNGQFSPGFSRAPPDGGWDLFNGPTDPIFGTWDMLSSIGPVTNDSAILLQWGGGFTPVVTTGGVLFFDIDFSGIMATFTAFVPGECPWDLDGDGNVFVTDLLVLLMDFGSCTGSPADFDGDGCVTVSDLLTLLANWGPCPGLPCVWDVNGDGTVDPTDLRLVLGNFGPCDGCPEDVNGDGVVNGQDAAAVATHFGPCP